MNIEKLFLSGTISEAPYILCKTEAAANYLKAWMHTYLTREPPIVVVSEWPTEIRCEAVAVTPIHVLGSNTEPMDFSIKAVGDLGSKPKQLLNIMIRKAMAGEQPTIRSMTAAMYHDQKPYSKRKTVEYLKELENAGLIRRANEREPFKLLFGRWRPDSAAAKAAGIEIEIK